MNWDMIYWSIGTSLHSHALGCVYCSTKILLQNHALGYDLRRHELGYDLLIYWKIVAQPCTGICILEYCCTAMHWDVIFRSCCSFSFYTKAHALGCDILEIHYVNEMPTPMQLAVATVQLYTAVQSVLNLLYSCTLLYSLYFNYCTAVRYCTVCTVHYCTAVWYCTVCTVHCCTVCTVHYCTDSTMVGGYCMADSKHMITTMACRGLFFVVDELTIFKYFRVTWVV